MHERVIVIDVSETHSEPICLINPELVELVGTEQMEEGCLSVPGVFELVERADSIKVSALDREGKPFTHGGERAAWQYAFNTRLTISTANCLSITCRNSSAPEFAKSCKNRRNWPVDDAGDGVIRVFPA